MSCHVYIIKTQLLRRTTDMSDPYEQDQKLLMKHLLKGLLCINEKNDILICGIF